MSAPQTTAKSHKIAARPKARTDSQEHDARDQRAGVDDARGGPDPAAVPRSSRPRPRQEQARRSRRESNCAAANSAASATNKTAERHPLGKPRAADQPLPLPQDDKGREPPESGEDEAPDPRRRKRERSHHHRGRHARPEIRAESRSRRASSRLAPLRSTPRARPHEADLTAAGSATAPKRRSRAAYWSSAATKAASSKSGHRTGRNTSSA